MKVTIYQKLSFLSESTGIERGYGAMLEESPCNGSGSANDLLAWRWSEMKNNVLGPNNGKSESLLPRK